MLREGGSSQFESRPMTFFYFQTGCNKNQITCDNSKCLPKDIVCDDVSDCVDGTDEANCSGEYYSDALNLPFYFCFLRFLFHSFPV